MSYDGGGGGGGGGGDRFILIYFFNYLRNKKFYSELLNYFSFLKQNYQLLLTKNEK